jgi:hypothetical protein
MGMGMNSRFGHAAEQGGAAVVANSFPNNIALSANQTLSFRLIACNKQISSANITTVAAGVPSAALPSTQSDSARNRILAAPSHAV